MDRGIIFQEYYEGYEISVSLYNDVVELYDTYNSHRAQFRIVDIEKYIRLCRELQDYQEYDDEEDEYYDPDEIYITDHDDGFLLHGDWVIPWRLEYCIDAIQGADISKEYNLDDIAKLNKEELKKYNTSMLGYILNSIKKQKKITTSLTAC